MTQQYIEGRRQSKERKREKRLGSSRRQESTIERQRERRYQVAQGDKNPQLGEGEIEERELTERNPQLGV
jgi:hypothetical protein